jgi:hypothetical protein
VTFLAAVACFCLADFCLDDPFTLAEPFTGFAVSAVIFSFAALAAARLLGGRKGAILAAFSPTLVEFCMNWNHIPLAAINEINCFDKDFLR